MPAINPFLDYAQDATSPAPDLVAIVPDNNNDFVRVVRKIRVGVGGDVALITSAGTTVTYQNCYSGEELGPFFVARVLATGTTASSMVGYY